MTPPRPRVAIVGGGLAGLTAARELAPWADVVVYESTDRIGGKLRTETVAGLDLDVGAEAMLSRRPEGTALAADLGLPVVHPTAATSRIWSRGALRRLPRSLLGLPLDLDDLAASGVLSPDGLDRAAQERDLPALVLAEDRSIGDLAADRFGDEVVDRLVEPLLGGVYAGHARQISVGAALPQLESMLAAGPLLGGKSPTGAAGTAVAAGPAGGAAGGPVFAGIEGGMARLPAALAADDRISVRTGLVVRELTRTSTGFRLVTGSAANPAADSTAVGAGAIEVDAVVLATPAAPTARLLGGLAPAAAAELAAIECASVAVVTMVYAAADLAVVPAGCSGFLVPPIEALAIKAATLSFAKWDWVRAAGGDLLALRTSLGRHREEVALQREDAELVAAGLADLHTVLGLRATPVATHVQRWGGGLPQYAVGHLDRVRRIRAGVAQVPGLAVCGAAYDGVGIPAVIASARRAAADLGLGG